MAMNSPLRLSRAEPIDIPPVRNLRDPDDRPAAAKADRRTQGERLMMARLRHFKTASMAARALGIAGPTYLAHENGTRQIRYDMALFYAEKFNVSPDWLLFNVGGGPDSGPGDPAEFAAAPALSSSAADDGAYGTWRGAGLKLLLQELNVSIAAGNTFAPNEPQGIEPRRLPLVSQTDGWIAELASPRAHCADECRVAVSDRLTLVLRDVLLIPELVVERARLFAVKLNAGVDLFGGQHLFVDPDATRVEDEQMFLVMRSGGSLMPACIMRSPAGGRLQIGRSRGKQPIDCAEADVQIVGRIHMQLKPVAEAEVRELAESIFESA
jgi:hypothetical protein